jgi:uncharacterized protein (TIGR02996 family)
VAKRRDKSSSLREALEAALVADPDDLGAHMAYADWLMEQPDPHDQAKGEFIQVQLALEDESRPAKERKRLQQREKELLDARQREWLGGLAPFLLDSQGTLDHHLEYHSDPRREFGFRRGWIDSLHIDNIDLPFARALKRAPEGRLLGWLEIETAFDSTEEYQPDDGVTEEATRGASAGICPLASSPFLTNVRHLRLGYEVGDDYQTYICHFHNPGIYDLVLQMPRLEELYLLANAFDLSALFSQPVLRQVRKLQVYHSTGVHRLQLLADNSAFRNLTHLLIHPHYFAGLWDHPQDRRDGYREEEGYLPISVIRPLLYSDNLPNLTHLQLRVSSLGDLGCEDVVRSGILKRLKVLDLRHGCITDKGVRLLAGSPDIRRLEFLDLDRNALTTEGIAAVRAIGIAVRVDNQQTSEEINRVSQYDSRPEPQYLYEGEFE